MVLGFLLDIYFCLISLRHMVSPSSAAAFFFSSPAALLEVALREKARNGRSRVAVRRFFLLFLQHHLAVEAGGVAAGSTVAALGGAHLHPQ